MVLFITTMIWAIWNTRHIDGDTGRPVPGSDAHYMGDDNSDGRIDEDESGWNCATMGNKICGTPR